MRLFSLLSLFFFLPSLAQAATVPIAQQMKGSILLSVEQHGEAWYVSPKDGERTYLQGPLVAYQVLRQQGVGITDADLARIPLAVPPLGSGSDVDGDGLDIEFEKAVGLDPMVADTDGDGVNDGVEIAKGLDPLRAKMAAPSIAFAMKHKGKIFLQVQHRGEAWWVNPKDFKRYYLGTPELTYALLRSQGKGISQKDLNTIPVTGNQIDCLGSMDCFKAAVDNRQTAVMDYQESSQEKGGFAYTFVTSLSFSSDDATTMRLSSDVKVYIPATEAEIRKNGAYSDAEVADTLARLQAKRVVVLGRGMTCTTNQTVVAQAILDHTYFTLPRAIPYNLLSFWYTKDAEGKNVVHVSPEIDKTKVNTATCHLVEDGKIIKSKTYDVNRDMAEFEEQQRLLQR
ncbi:hypothetical protein HYV73_04310 [Candidatus Uhrbacteria bacterium]|nr:hypothetical protein [Candidatus Uhrbacteria bacterium]